MSKDRTRPSSSKITRKPSGYWHKFSNLKKELKAFIKAQQVGAGLMPTTRLLRRTGRKNLLYAIQQHGGSYIVAAKLGLRVPHSPAGYRMPLGKLGAEIRRVIKACGGPGYMPTQAEFFQVGRGDLLQAIRQWGGSRQVAERFQLKPKRAKFCIPDTPRDKNWLKTELAAFARTHDLEGQMPTARQLLSARRRDLYNAIRGMGGFVKIAQRMGWRLSPRAQARSARARSGSQPG